MLGEFRAFLLKTNALALAIGVIIGAALGTVVNSLVNDIIMPPVGLVLGGVDFASAKYVLKEAVNGDPGDRDRDPLRPLRQRRDRLHRRGPRRLADLQAAHPQEAPAEIKTCPFCKEPNAVEATKCRACASQI